MQHGLSAGVLDLFRLKRVDGPALANVLADMGPCLPWRSASGGRFRRIVAETLIDRGAMKPIKRLGLQDGFDVVNGDRDTLHDLYGIDTPHIVEAALALKRG